MLPHLIALIFVLWLAFFVAQLAMLAGGPILAGWLAFILGRAAFRSDVRMSIESRIASLISLDSRSDKLAFRLSGDPREIVESQERELYIPAIAATGFACLVYFVLLKLGQFDKIPLVIGLPFEFTGPIGLATVVAGVVAAIAVTRVKTPHAKFVLGALQARVDSLNWQSAAIDEFDREASTNGSLIKSLGGSPDQPKQALLIAIQDNIGDIIRGSLSLQALLDEQTRTLRAENAMLAGLNQKHDALWRSYNKACKEANRVGNEAVFRYLDMLAKGIRSLGELVIQHRWDDFSRLIDGAQAELEDLLANIDRIEEAAYADADEGSPGNGTDEQDPCAVLGVRPDLPNDELKRVYRSLAQIYHPDKGMCGDPRRFQQIQTAWERIRAERKI